MNYNAYPWGRWIKWGIALIVIVVLLFSFTGTYNGLTSADQDVKSKWSQVENVMQSRADVINNLVEVVKGYTKHEEKVFGDVAAARSVLINGSDIKKKLSADATIGNAGKSILMLAENYPDLKASEQFQNLQVAIEGSERRVAVERKRFIDSVQSYNTKITRFPGNIFSKMMGFGTKDYFEANSEGKQAPKVKF
jgi:LemA protein